MDTLAFFRAEIETVGRHWREMLAAFDPESALVRPAPNMNHALWLTGHMAWAEDYLVVEVPTGNILRRKEWDRLFDHGSEKLPPERYPPFRDVVGEYLRVHAEVMKALHAMRPVDLGKPSAVEKRWFATPAHAISHQVTHGHYHLGQLVYLEKMLEAGSVDQISTHRKREELKKP